MLIAQISDCHIGLEAHPGLGALDASTLLEQTIDVIKALPQAPDLVLATGDLAEHGRPEEYQAFAASLAKLAAPVLPLVGNHDQRQSLISALGLRERFALQDGFVQYCVDMQPLRILALDTVTPGSPDPSYCSKRLHWLKARLDESDAPTLVAMHHPPVPNGPGWLRPHNADWAAPLASVLKGRSNIQRIVCGHVHRGGTESFAGLVVSCAPSTAHQVYLDLGAEAAPAFSAEPGGFLAHQWGGEQLSTRQVVIQGASQWIAL